MLLGYKGEAEIIAKMGKAVRSSIFTSATNQVAAMKALKIKKFVGIGYDFDDTSIVARYFTDAGFNVLELAKLPGPWEEVGRLSSRTSTLRRESCFCAIATRTGFISRAANCASSISSNRWNRISACR